MVSLIHRSLEQSLRGNRKSVLLLDVRHNSNSGHGNKASNTDVYLKLISAVCLFKGIMTVIENYMYMCMIYIHIQEKHESHVSR